MAHPFTISTKNDGTNLALGVLVVFESTSDRALVEERRRARVQKGSTWRPPLWGRPNDSATEWAPMVTFTMFHPSEGITARSVLHPVSSLSPLWGSVEVASALVLMLDERQLGTGTVQWIRRLPPGLPHGEVTRFVNWSAGVPGSVPEK